MDSGALTLTRFEIQFMSGTFWRVEAASAPSITSPLSGWVKVTRLIDKLEGEPRSVEAWLNPETIEAVWEAAE